jgi:hypothetical protein
VLRPLSEFEVCAAGAGAEGCYCYEVKYDKVAGEGTAVVVSNNRDLCRRLVSGRANVLASAANDGKDAIREPDRDG